MKQLLIGCGVFFAIIFVICIGGAFMLGVMIEQGEVPPSETMHGGKMTTTAKEAIDEIVGLRPGEEIQYYYCDALMSYRGDGNLVTDQRVISYEESDGAFTLYEADYNEIASVDPSFSDQWIENTVVFIETKDGDSFLLLFDIEGGLDRKAVEYIESRIEPAAGVEVGPQEE